MRIYDGSDEPPDGDTPDRIKVGIAEYEVTTNGSVLTTSGLGSCIGVALHDEETGISGLVHAMLPSAEDEEEVEGGRAKFADTGTEILLEELEATGADMASVEAKIAGGSAMLDFSDQGEAIGERNVDRARAVLAAHDVPVVAEDVGGEHGRSVRLEGETGDYVVRSANEGSKTL